MRPDPTRTRKLLLHRTEINRLIGKVERAGYTMTPLNLHFTKGRIKLDIGLARGKKQYDKRAAVKEREWNREKLRLLRGRPGGSRTAARAMRAPASPEVELRAARRGDVPQIARIYAEQVATGTASFEYAPPSVADMERRYDAIVAAGYPYFVAANGEGEIVGYSFASAYRPGPAIATRSRTPSMSRPPPAAGVRGARCSHG